eukprot:12419832-Karenia_brevis.AAC.1
MMTCFPKTFPSEGPKVRYLSVKSGLPESSGTLRRIKSFQQDQVSFAPIRDLPNTRRWSG